MGIKRTELYSANKVIAQVIPAILSLNLAPAFASVDAAEKRVDTVFATLDKEGTAESVFSAEDRNYAITVNMATDFNIANYKDPASLLNSCVPFILAALSVPASHLGEVIAKAKEGIAPKGVAANPGAGATKTKTEKEPSLTDEERSAAESKLLASGIIDANGNIVDQGTNAKINGLYTRRPSMKKRLEGVTEGKPSITKKWKEKLVAALNRERETSLRKNQIISTLQEELENAAPGSPAAETAKKNIAEARKNAEKIVYATDTTYEPIDPNALTDLEKLWMEVLQINETTTFKITGKLSSTPAVEGFDVVIDGTSYQVPKANDIFKALLALKCNGVIPEKNSDVGLGAYIEKTEPKNNASGDAKPRTRVVIVGAKDYWAKKEEGIPTYVTDSSAKDKVRTYSERSVTYTEGEKTRIMRIPLVVERDALKRDATYVPAFGELSKGIATRTSTTANADSGHVAQAVIDMAARAAKGIKGIPSATNNSALEVIQAVMSTLNTKTPSQNANNI